jgi:hypothetical protein
MLTTMSWPLLRLERSNTANTHGDPGVAYETSPTHGATTPCSTYGWPFARAATNQKTMRTMVRRRA